MNEAEQMEDHHEGLDRLGALSMSLFHPVTAARASVQLRVHTYEVPKIESSNYMTVSGAQVVGFSCIPTPEQPRCFVATSE